MQVARRPLGPVGSLGLEVAVGDRPKEAASHAMPAWRGGALWALRVCGRRFGLSMAGPSTRPSTGSGDPQDERGLPIRGGTFSGTELTPPSEPRRLDDYV